MLSREIFEILPGVMAFPVLFKQILIKLFVPHSEFFIKYDAFVPHFRFARAYFRPGVDPKNFDGKT